MINIDIISYPVDREIADTTDTPKWANYLDFLLEFYGDDIFYIILINIILYHP